MSQHDFIIDNAPGASVRTDLNNVLQAIVTNNSGATEPAVTFPNMWWYDTSTSLLKRRNNANDAWITIGLEAADIDGTLAANSDSKIATQKATKTYADTKVSLTGDQTIAGVKTFSSPPIGIPSNPTGSIILYSGSSAPTGYLICDGAAISRTTYSDLYAVIGTVYGPGNGSTTFNLPNLKGKVPVGLNSAETEFDALGETGGEKTHALTEAELASHTHNIFVPGSGTYADGVLGTTPSANTRKNDVATSSTGSGTAHNNLQPYLVLNYIIKT